jgi:hypothetical protein
MPFSGIKEVIDAELDGKVRQYVYRKIPSGSTTQGIWFDFSMSPGMPGPKYWFDAAPLTAKAITQSSDGGFYHGPNVSPGEKYLRSVSVYGASSSTSNPCPSTLILCDYILYYPTVDDGTTDEQLMNNAVTLPRYADGNGVQMVAVTTGSRVGGQTFTVKYTNQDGVTGRTTPTLLQNASSVVGTITNTNISALNGAGPFLPLQSGDSGVRAVESVTMNGVDIGLFSIILVKPLAQITLREISISTAGTTGAAYEKDLLLFDNNLPRIYDDAFLGYLSHNIAAANNTTFTGALKVIWT